MDLPEAEVFDMDGTLIDIRGIRHLVEVDEGGKKNFHAFHMASVNCPPHDWVVEGARRAQEAGRAVLVLTARSTLYRHPTAWSLALHNVPSDRLFMRRFGDFRPDYEVKKDIAASIMRRWKIVRAWDDNPNVIALWQELDIPCVEVPGWGQTLVAP